MENNVEYTNSCRFNKGVDCSDYEYCDCNNCGWNPDVYAKRIKKIKTRLATYTRNEENK